MNQKKNWPDNPVLSSSEFIIEDESIVLTAYANTITSPYGLNFKNYSSLLKLWIITAYADKFYRKSKGTLLKQDIDYAQIK